MSDEEEETGPMPDTREEQSVWDTVEDLKRSNLAMKKALGRQNLEIQAVHQAIEAIATAQQEGQEKLAEYFEDLSEEEATTKSKKSKKMSKRRDQEVELELEQEEDEGMSTTTKMFLSGLAGFVAGSAVTTLYFKYSANSAGLSGASTPVSMQGLSAELPRSVVQMR